MLATTINNNLYGCKKLRLAQANGHRIETDALEEYSQYQITIGAGQMNH